jgi:site-specific recombinase XerD
MELTLIEEFCEYLKANGRNPNTITEYERNLRKFAGWCSALSHESFFELTTEDIQGYYAEINLQYSDRYTIHKKCKSVQKFYEWLRQEGRILFNPSPVLSEMQHNNLPSVITEQSTIRNAMNKLEKSSSLVEKRDRVMIDLAYSCGLRRCELHNFNIQDIQGNFLRVTGKRGKEREVPIGEKALAGLLDYINHVRPKLCKTGNTSAVFVSWNQGGKRMHLYSINAVLRRLRKKYALDNSLRPHALRHAFGRDMILSGCPVQNVSKMLGHTKLETTQIYTRLAPLELQKAHQLYHPRS